FYRCGSFFCSSDAHRHLPSFPTRRSSDLCAETASARGVREPDVEHVAANRAASVFDHEDRVPQAFDAHACAKRIQVRVGGHCAQDRKSTRLNSSHDQISYAVFCLKKKKKI